MIKLESIELHNFLRHKHFKHTFGDASVTMITGENGCGKTSIMSALSFAFRGVIPSKDKKAPQARAVRHGAKSLSVTLEFKSSGAPAKITRSITAGGKSSRTLEWDGRTITSDAEVDKIMQNILGADLQAVENLVFIPQGTLDKLLMGTEAERRLLWSRLTSAFDTDKTYSILQDFIRRLSGGVVDYAVARQMAVDNLASAEAECVAATAALAELPDGTIVVDATTHLARMLSQYTAVENARASLAVLDGNVKLQTGTTDVLSDEEIDGLQERRNTAVQTIADLNSRKHKRMLVAVEIETMKSQRAMAEQRDKLVAISVEQTAALQALNAARPSAWSGPSAEECYQHQQTYKRYGVAKNDLSIAQMLLHPCQAAATAAAEASAKANQANTDAFAARSRVETELQRAAKLLELVVGTESCSCPVCGQSVTSATEFIQTTHARLQDELQAATIAWSQAAKDAATLNAERETTASTLYKQKTLVAELTAEIAKTEALLPSLPPEDTIPGLLSSIRAHADETARWQGDVVAATNALRSTETQLASLQAVTDSVAILDAKLARAHAALASIPEVLPSEEAANSEALKQIDARLEPAIARRAQLRQALANYEAAQQLLESTSAALAASIANMPAIIREVPRMSGPLTYEKISETSAEFNAFMERIRDARSTADSAQKLVASYANQIAEVDAKIAAQAKKEALVADLKIVAEAFSPNGALMDYLNYEFGRVVLATQDYLAETGAPFAVAASESSPLSFDFRKIGEDDAAWLPQSQLSGGQGVTLALGVIQACHALFIPSVGIMCLDEPSLHLSQTAQDQLAEWLRGIDASGHLQMVACDHSPVLANAAGSLIEL